MAKNSVKRKLEADVSVGRDKPHITEKLNDESSEDVSDGLSLPVTRAPKRRGYVKKSKENTGPSELARLSLNDDYKEEDEPTESQNFINLVKMQNLNRKMTLKNARGFISKFMKNIQDSQKSLEKHIEHSRTTSIQHDTAFISAFMNAYASSRPAQPRENVAAKAAFASLYTRSQCMIDEAYRTVALFDETNRKVLAINVKNLIDVPWEHESDAVAQVLEAGHRVGLEKYTAWLHGETEPVIDEQNAVAAEAMYHSDKCDHIVGLGFLAAKQARATKKMFKAGLLTTAA